MGIGDTFNARVAGNIANKDLTGSLEFACAAAGAKVVLVALVQSALHGRGVVELLRSSGNASRSRVVTQST